MKIAILAGGAGSRLAEETAVRPKPMIEIGGWPILWHIMKHYDYYGFKHFVVALGYKGEVIREFMENFCKNSGSMFLDFNTRQSKYLDTGRLDWKVELIETGLKTLTGGRIKRLAPYLGDDTFMLTWGDGVSNVNLKDLLAFHRSHGKMATMTAVRPMARYGHIEFEGNRVTQFNEKPQTSEGWINGAFFVLEPSVFDYIDGDNVMWEHAPLERLAADGQLMAYKHESFWQCMDTLREKHMLEQMWQSGNPPWKIWED